MKSLVLVLVPLLAGCSFLNLGGPAARAVSPDGRTEICLYAAPLAYEVLRDGLVMVPRSPIGLTVDGRDITEEATIRAIVDRRLSGRLETPIYKKKAIDLTAAETFVDCGRWGVRLVARNDGVAYRFETKLPGTVCVTDEKMSLRIPFAAKGWTYYTTNYGYEESTATYEAAAAITTATNKFFYIPYTYVTDGKYVSVVESDVRDYPNLYFNRDHAASAVTLRGHFASMPTAFYNKEGDETNVGGKRLRFIFGSEFADYLVQTEGTRTFPWRGFIVADKASDLCESDLVYALAAEKSSDDFAWVKPGKVAWDWWNAFDNKGDPEGCTTETYRRFIDFAAENGVEYVIFDEGWSEKLNIWKDSPVVDVPALIKYANERGVGIILWMAWGQVYGDEDRVASHFAKLGAKGFKVDFINRADADSNRFLERFAAACAKEHMLVDYHGLSHPTGLQRKYPNILNYEGVFGLEQMKFYRPKSDIITSDLMTFFGRMTVGPLDYTPGAMDNKPLGQYPAFTGWKDIMKSEKWIHPGSLGTRARQMAMMALYEAPLQMLCDSPTKYEKNMECFKFMARTPVVWDATVGLGGSPLTYAAVARQAKDGAWYVAVINGTKGRTINLPSSFLPAGDYRTDFFCDAEDANEHPRHYVHEKGTLKAGDPIPVTLANGGGFVMRIYR